MDADSSSRSTRDSRRRPRSQETRRSAEKVPYFANADRERDRIRNLHDRPALPTPRTSRSQEARRKVEKVPYFADAQRERDRVRNLHQRSPRPTPRASRRTRSAEKTYCHRRRSSTPQRERRRRRSRSRSAASSRRRRSSRSRSRSRSHSRTPRIITVPVPVPAADYPYAYGWSHHHPQHLPPPPRQHFNPMYGPMIFGLNPRSPHPNSYYAPYPRPVPFRFRARNGPFQMGPRLYGYNYGYRNEREPWN